MPFTFSEQHIADYYHHGYTVFRGILPPSLVRDLRRVTDRAREIAREEHGPQAQRLQPVKTYESRLDLQPFRDYTDLPELMDALQKVLSPEHAMEGLPLLGILFEPAERPWCTAWHRDITAQTRHINPDEFRTHVRNPTFFNQINCALYTDTCAWYVPGSDGRPDTAAEQEAARQQPNLDGKSEEDCERLNLAYCQGMPGAVQFVLEPGDFALYRSTGWHIGNYAPYRKRATLHDAVWDPEARRWFNAWLERLRQEQEKKG